MFNKDFCVQLEFDISCALENSPEKDRRRCWCDGVIMPPEEYLTTENVNNNRKVITKAWIDEGRIKGKDLGQSLYELTIWFGERSVEEYLNGKNLKECVPIIEADDWIFLDTKNKIIEIEL